MLQNEDASHVVSIQVQQYSPGYERHMSVSFRKSDLYLMLQDNIFAPLPVI